MTLFSDDTRRDPYIAGIWEPRKAFHVHGPTRLPIHVARVERPRTPVGAFQ